MKIFLSHATPDKGLVEAVRRSLSELGDDGWIDARELTAGDILETEIRQAIEESGGFLLFVTPEALQSRWVGKELKMALEVQERRGKVAFPIILLSVDDTKLGVLEQFFPAEPLYLPIRSGPGGVEEALPKIREALGQALPSVAAAGAGAAPPPPIEELVLLLSSLDFEGERPRAVAKLIHRPADPRADAVESDPFPFRAPIGAIELDDLRWYLEDYARWPGGFVEERVRRVETDLTEWGKALYREVLAVDEVEDVLLGWSQATGSAARRFSVQIDDRVLRGEPEDRKRRAQEAGTRLLSLPWELLHNGKGFLFQGAKPVRVRRRLPTTTRQDSMDLSLPIRILLVCARPEDDACAYIDHRASAEPLVQATEALPGLVTLTVLEPATFPALLQELKRASDAHTPYHVVHFDGHGVYSRERGLGGLCFESPQDAQKLVKRGHETIYTDRLSAELRGFRIPLIFLDACQGAQGEDASGSVASALLQAGIGSVVAMTHSVLVPTTARFVEAFYKALAEGSRVGEAMLAGQRYLEQDSFRLDTFTGPLHLQDWFVPVLYQEEYDPQLFTRAIAPRALEENKAQMAARQGAVPPEPPTGFIGRSKELLTLERLLGQERWAVILGEGGEGKTALACELARWLLRSHRITRAAFVCVEGFDANPADAVLDSLGKQLVASSFSVSALGGTEALKLVERALRESRALLVLDNLESLLLPPYINADHALEADAREALGKVLTLCQRLMTIGETRIVFTSREALPEPFAALGLRLTRLAKPDAVRFVERVLQSGPVSVDPGSALARARREEIEALVDAVQGHARTLSLLAPSLRSIGVVKTRELLVPLMEQMEREFPGAREKSLFASVALSLKRLSPENQERVKALAPFHGGADLDLVRVMMGWETEEADSFGRDLLETGLATLGEYNYLHLTPALCPYLRAGMDAPELGALMVRWQEVMLQYVGFLNQQQSQNTQLAATLTLLELPGLVALLERVEAEGDPTATIDLTTSLHQLVHVLGKPRVMARIAQARDRAEKALGSDTWSHAAFTAQATRIEQQLKAGQLQEAYTGATQLLERARQAGEQAYPDADYDLAVAHFLIGRILGMGGRPQEALPYLKEAEQRFEAVEHREPGCGAANMASACLTDQADCLTALGRLDQAATLYEIAIERGKQRGATRNVAVDSIQLGSVRLDQRRFTEALQAYQKALQTSTDLGEPDLVAIVWHQIGMVHTEAKNAQAAEDAYVKSLDINTRAGNLGGQASTLNQLGLLYDSTNRLEGAIPFYRQAADRYIKLSNNAKEGSVRNNLADTLRLLGRYTEAREEAYKALECKKSFGLAADPWKTWDILHEIERAERNAQAATDAHQKALELYLEYRRQGGENHSGVGRLCQLVTASLRGQSTPENQVPPPDQLKPELEELLASAPTWNPFIPLLLRIVDGERDRALADAPGLNYQEAAEIHVLLDGLGAAPD